MIKKIVAAVLLVACAPRNVYFGAKPEDIKFCRLEAQMTSRVRENSTYNDCMEALGYQASP